MKRIEFQGEDVTIVGDADGPEAGVPLVFLHGGGQTRQSWGRAVTEAARRGYRAITLDLRGHGESGWAPDGRYGMEGFTGDIRRVIATLDRPPVLVGASLGGFTALLLAADPPPAVAGLILVDIAPRIESAGTSQIGAFMNSAPNGFASLEEAADAVSAYLPHRKRPKNTSGLMRNLRLREDGRLHWHWDPAFIRPRQNEPPRNPLLFEQAARKVHVPTLLVRGGQSQVVSEAGAREFLDLVPGAEWVDVAGADHMVAGDANDSFNKAIFAFLARHVPAGRGAPAA